MIQTTTILTNVCCCCITGMAKLRPTSLFLRPLYLFSVSYRPNFDPTLHLKVLIFYNSTKNGDNMATKHKLIENCGLRSKLIFQFDPRTKKSGHPCQKGQISKILSNLGVNNCFDFEGHIRDNQVSAGHLYCLPKNEEVYMQSAEHFSTDYQA